MNEYHHLKVILDWEYLKKVVGFISIVIKV